MKKIILFLLISGSVFADGFYSAGSFGYDWIYDHYKTSATIGYEFRGLFLEAEQNTNIVKADLHMFKPYETEYFARIKYTYKQVFIQWEHLCIHGIEDYESTALGHDRFTIGFDTRLNEKTNHIRGRRN